MTTIQAEPQPRQRSAVVRIVRLLVWMVSAIAAVAGCSFGYIVISMASGAPQEASGAAMGLLIAVGPYVFARAVSEMLE